MRKLHLDTLKKGIPLISTAFGALFAEAAAVCLTLMGHSSGIVLKVEGDIEAEFSLNWTKGVSETEMASWSDLKEAVEYGATGLALLLIAELVGFDQFRREDQAQGTDFEIRKTNLDGDKLEVSKLEISGILSETQKNTITARINLKKQKIKGRGDINLPVYLVVVEFGIPKANIIKI